MAMDNLLQYAETGFTKSEIQAIIRSIYNNTAFHGIAQFDPSTDSKMQPQDTNKPDLEIEPETTPLMPIDGFPDFVQHFILECSRIYGTHRDLWTSAIFAATSTALGQSVILKTKFMNPPLF